MAQEDPGWWPSIRGLPFYLLLPILSKERVAEWREETNGLVGLRNDFLRFFVPLSYFLFAVVFFGPWGGERQRWVPWAVAGAGVCTLGAMAWLRQRPLVTESLEALARSYRRTFFAGQGLALVPALFGLVGVAIGDSGWPYLVGFAFALVAMWLIGPTRRNIEDRQFAINAAGSLLSLLNALISAPPPEPL